MRLEVPNFSEILRTYKFITRTIYSDRAGELMQIYYQSFTHASLGAVRVSPGNVVTYISRPSANSQNILLNEGEIQWYMFYRQLHKGNTFAPEVIKQLWTQCGNDRNKMDLVILEYFG